MGQFAAQFQKTVHHLVDHPQHQVRRAGGQAGAGRTRFAAGGLYQFDDVSVACAAVSGVHGQQNMVEHGKGHGAGVDTPQNGRTTASGFTGQYFTRVLRVGVVRAGRQAAKYEHVVLRGVVVVRRQMVVHQVRDVKVHQLLARQGKQHGLHGALLHFELVPCAGHPDKAVGWATSRRQRIQIITFGNSAGLNVKDAHRFLLERYG